MLNNLDRGHANKEITMSVCLLLFLLLILIVAYYFADDADSGEPEFVHDFSEDSMLDDPFAFQRIDGPQVYRIGPQMISFD